MRLATEDMNVMFNAIEWLLAEEGVNFFENGIGPDDTLVAHTTQFGDVYFTLGEPDDVESNYGIEVINAEFEDPALEKRFIYTLDTHLRGINSDTEYEVTPDERWADDA